MWMKWLSGEAGVGVGVVGDNRVLAAAQQEAVQGEVGVEVNAHNLARGVDPVGLGEDGVGRVESRVLAAAHQEAVQDEVGVVVIAHDLPAVIDPVGLGRAGYGVGGVGERRVLAAAQQES